MGDPMALTSGTATRPVAVITVAIAADTVSRQNEVRRGLPLTTGVAIIFTTAPASLLFRGAIHNDGIRVHLTKYEV
jgi:hypothetical protein